MKATNTCIGTTNIRAAGLWRLVGNMKSLSKREPGLFSELVNVDDPKNIVLTNMILHMNINGGRAISTFPTDNMNDIANAIHDILKCYAANPEIHIKINLLWATLLVGSIFMSDEKIHSANKRAKEVKDLNMELYELSKKMVGKELEVEPSAILLENHDANNKDKHILFTISLKPK